MKPLEKLERDKRNHPSHEKTRKITNARIKLGNIQIPDTIIAMVPPEVAEKYLVIPIIANHGKLVVAMAGPLGRAAESDLRFITQMPIRVAISPQGDIIEALQRYYPKRDSEIDQTT